MELNLTTPAVLFPAISLLMLAYTNRYLAIASLIRDLYSEYKNGQDEVLLQQITILRYRIRLIRNMQFYGVLSFLLCVVCMFALFFGWHMVAVVLFAASLLLLMVSLFLSTLDIQQSVRALDLQLRDLEER